jgi:hypothetical protein
MDADGVQEKAPLFAAMRPAQLIQVIVIGVVVGAFSWIFAQVLGMYVLKPASCTGDAFVCAASSQPAIILAAILAGCIGLFGLVKLQIFRPLLIVIAATMSLWGVVGLLTALPWYLSLLTTVLFYAIAYTAFMWVARIRTFWLVLVLFVLLVVGVRLIITA